MSSVALDVIGFLWVDESSEKGEVEMVGSAVTAVGSK